MLNISFAYIVSTLYQNQVQTSNAEMCKALNQLDKEREESAATLKAKKDERAKVEKGLRRQILQKAKEARHVKQLQREVDSLCDALDKARDGTAEGKIVVRLEKENAALEKERAAKDAEIKKLRAIGVLPKMLAF